MVTEVMKGPIKSWTAIVTKSPKGRNLRKKHFLKLENKFMRSNIQEMKIEKEE